MDELKVFSISDLKRKSGPVLNVLPIEPVVIKHDHRDDMVLMTLKHYENLRERANCNGE